MEDIEITETTDTSAGHSEALAEESQITPEPDSSVSHSEQSEESLPVEPEPEEIPQIYLYDRITKEYTGMQTAEKDPAESKIQGKFVPLVNAGETLTAPPETGENETVVFNSGVWEVKPDYRKNYKKADSGLNISDITETGELEEGYILVTNEIASDIAANVEYYYIQDGEILKKTDEEVEAEKAQAEAERIANLSLTAADVERALYKAFGKDFDDIVAMVEALQTSNSHSETLAEESQEANTAADSSAGHSEGEESLTTISSAIDIKALKIELKANNFYRGNAYVDTIGTLLGITSSRLDEFFETNDYTKLCHSEQSEESQTTTKETEEMEPAEQDI